MGGAGSGRWGWHSKKTTVEECLTLTASKLVRDGVIARSPGWGSLWWANNATGEVTASAGYRREINHEQIVLDLRYVVGRGDGAQDTVNERIGLQTTASAVGGVRWWFTCPLIVDGRYCGRRAGKLYLPPGSRYFGCRHCHDLTYTSCQESHQYDRVFRRLAADTASTSLWYERCLLGADSGQADPKRTATIEQSLCRSVTCLRS